MLWFDLLRLVAVVLLVLANAFFVAAEFALVGVRRTRIAELVAKGNVSARSVQRAIADPDRFIAATQLGITLASLGLGWIGEQRLATFSSRSSTCSRSQSKRNSHTVYPLDSPSR